MIILNAADVLSATAGAGSALTVTVFGMENTSAAQTFKRLYQGQPGNTATTLYTVPSSTQTLIKTITVANTTGSAETLELFAAGTAAANVLMPAISIDAGGMAVYDGNGWTFTTSNGAPKESVAAPAGTLTGTTLASNVVASSLTSVGTLAALTVTATIIGAVSGNAGTATTLATAQAINGVDFDGSAPITVAAAAGTLTGGTLAAGVTASSLTSVGTLSSLTLGGDTDFDNNQVDQPKFKTYTEIVPTPAISTNTLVLDLTTGNTFRVTLSANVTTLTISNPATSGVAQSFTLILDQSGSFTVTWPASVHWAGGTAPTQSATNAKTDIFTFLTTNGGTTWYGFTGGLKFTT